MDPLTAINLFAFGAMVLAWIWLPLQRTQD